MPVEFPNHVADCEGFSIVLQSSLPAIVMVASIFFTSVRFDVNYENNLVIFNIFARLMWAPDCLTLMSSS